MALTLLFAAVSGGLTALTVLGGVSPWWILPLWLGYYAAVALTGIVLLILALYLFLPAGNPSPRMRRFNHRIVRSVLAWLTVMVGTRIKVQGAYKLPDAPYLLVGNHRSAFDPLCSLVVFPDDTVFVAKPSVLRIPILGSVLGRMGFLGIDRDNARNAVATIKRAAELIRDVGLCVGIYPEGTRSKDGNLLPLHAGSFKIAKLANCPVAVVSVRVKKWGLFPHYVELRVVDVMDADYVAESNTAAMSERAEQVLRTDLGL
ncbi:MAG: 1-acyl-sn-glycerol-3-phosphate acyltransferase [Clostridia bacterium]|nr:1-acyl-sn-glycerol-3-phosphate acyltransferase [Clostridia bacterium]